MSATRTSNRKALNDLLYSPNKKESIGVSNRNDLKSNHLKKRTSISLPDICSQALNSNPFNSSFNRSEASTPNKSSLFKSANTPALKLNKRNNISVILEEKENPNLAFGIHLDKNLKGSISKLEKLASSDECLVSIKKEKKVEYKETGIQCNKGQEDMLFSESVDNTPFWKLMAHKRLKCLIKTELENSEISSILDELNSKNEILRSKNDSLNKLMNEYDEIRKMMLESTQNDDEEEYEDSGYDVSHAN